MVLNMNTFTKDYEDIKKENLIKPENIFKELNLLSDSSGVSINLNKKVKKSLDDSEMIKNRLKTESFVTA